MVDSDNETDNIDPAQNGGQQGVVSGARLDSFLTPGAGAGGWQILILNLVVTFPGEGEPDSVVTISEVNESNNLIGSGGGTIRQLFGEPGTASRRTLAVRLIP